MRHPSLAFVTCLFSGMFLIYSPSANSQETDFAEQFALAKDRTVPLGQLIPGTVDYYYYTCLHLQNTEKFEAVDQMMQDWHARHSADNRYREIQYRQALLTYNRNPEKTLTFIRKELGLTFNHQRDRIDEAPRVPSLLDPRLLDHDRLLKLTLRRDSGLAGFEDAGMHWLVTASLDADRRRALLNRLDRPDYESLPRMIIDDLQHPFSGGFGSLKIHGRLLKKQLDELLRLRPQLRNEKRFVDIYLSRLAPENDVDLARDTEERIAWLDRLQSFVGKLSPAHNSLKAHVLYHRLVLDQQLGQRNRKRFIEYLKLPRDMFYMNREWLRQPLVARQLCNLNQSFVSTTGLANVGNDEPLLRDYLLEFFREDKSIDGFKQWLEDGYLTQLFAEAKIVNGLGDPERWYSSLPADKYKQLKDRVDIDFLPTNRRYFSPEEQVSLEVSIKNVPTLIVKVFEINTLNFHRDNLKNINTDINLDGLIANDEQIYDYTEPPLRRVTRRFSFPKLDKRGTYVIDFIGNGQSSRALVRKGKLRHLVQTTPAGQAFTILDETDQVVEDARVYLGGQQYDATNGVVTVPFSNEATQKTCVIATADGFSSIAKFESRKEVYQLSGGFYVDRESLLRQRKAKLLVRPLLKLNGIPVSLSMLEDVTLTIASEDHDKVRSMQRIADFKLFEDRESVHEFSVPPRLSEVSFALQATIKVNSTDAKTTLTLQNRLRINQIDKSEIISDMHLLKSDLGYIVEMRGKSGELRKAHTLNVLLKHRDFKAPIQQALATDDAGQVVLGPLDHIEYIRVNAPGCTDKRWTLESDRHNYYRIVHAAAGEDLQIPWMTDGKIDRSKLSLFELRGSAYVSDRYSAIRLQDGFLNISDLNAGDYELSLYPGPRRILIRVSEGETRNGFVAGRNRQLERRGEDGVQIESVEFDGDDVLIRLANVSDTTRVHVLGTRYVPEFDPFRDLAVFDAEPLSQRTPRQALSAYIEGRNIGDEYRYILERRHETRFPGNMNERPGMLLNPFVLQTTETGRLNAARGGEFAPGADADASMLQRAQNKRKAEGEGGGYCSLDFLPVPAIVNANLVADEDGLIRFPVGDLARHQHLRVVAVDTLNTAIRTLNTAAAPATRVDLRLAESFDPEQHLDQVKEFRLLSKGETVESDANASLQMEVIDSLPRAYQLLRTLNRSTALAEFEFVTRWPRLKAEEKRSLYSRFACHELSFFIAKKDKAFFREVVHPYLANKLHKTFMDHYLLQNDLTAYLDPWEYARLNTAEKILLADRIVTEAPHMRRYISDAADLIPVNVTRNTLVFDTAFGSNALQAMEGKGKAINLFSQRVSGMAGDTSVNGGLAGDGFMANGFGGGFGGGGGSGVSSRGRVRRSVTEPHSAEKESLLSELADLEAEAPISDSLKRVRQLREETRELPAYQMIEKQKQLYRAMKPTQEWVENNYYKLPVERQLAGLVGINDFWRDFAQRDPDEPFVSRNLLTATSNLTEMLLALAVSDLPFDAAEHANSLEDGVARFTAGSSMIVAVDEIRKAEVADEGSSILVSQNFYKLNDRYRQVGNRKLDKFITDEFVVNTVYGCQVAVTNPTSSPQTLSLILQVPQGALPVRNSKYTHRQAIDLKPFTTQTHNYFFYFPSAGDCTHYPVQVTAQKKVLAFAKPFAFHVVDKPSTIDTESWDHVSQFASTDKVIEFLKSKNLNLVDLGRIAWRMKDKAFFAAATNVLHQRHAFHSTLWSYSVMHNDQTGIQQYLANEPRYCGKVGMHLKSPLLSVDPIDRHFHQHRDYSPLVNARAHRLGTVRRIPNDKLRTQWQSLTRLLSYQTQFDDEQLMTITYYLLLQDRVEEAIGRFAAVNPENVSARIQYDYCAAYLDFYEDEPTIAAAMCQKYADHPVDRWRNRFAAMQSQLNEINGEDPEIQNPEDSQQNNTLLASADCSFDLDVDHKEVAIDFQNVETITVNYYLMDIELLFSRNPFVQQYGSRFSNIRPNLTQTIELPAEQQQHTFELPQELHNSNVLVEVSGRGMKKTAVYYSNSLSVQMIENYGQLKVSDENNRGLSRVYVKTYARMKDGQVKFYKDGYTDLRGRFDYSSLNTSELEQVERFAVLVMSESNGAVVEEVRPPQR